MSRAYYNEFDKKAAAWLRELIKAGVIADGDVDERSITEVKASDLSGYTQHHFFAGIGGWSYALRLAGWSDDRPVWTGSCPCQPFSAAGKGLGTKDERHLWPEFFRLITLCRPSVVFGEQVASKAGRAWLAAIRTDVEDLGYAVGAADLCAAGIGAPHVRQRLYFVADAECKRIRGERSTATTSTPRRMQSENEERERIRAHARATGAPAPALDDPDGRYGFWWSGPLQVGWNAIEGEVERSGRKYRAQWPLGPGVRIVAHGIPNRVGALCGAGNAIVPQLAAEFIQAYEETR